ncbi:MAG: lipopolysaccharide biosynthesis protein [Proteiniphilum sp.]|nr:lipopolysaccharide biosynthesis protein [Proteiniphilum sp.]
MASEMRKLAKETTIYGISSIVPKLLSWFLGLYWAFELETRAEMGAITNFYAYVALFQVILTYGMETGFFRFANKEKNPITVYSTTLISIFTTTLLFLLVSLSLINPISGVLSGFGMIIKPHYLVVILLILAIDVIASIPFAYLRFRQRPVKFASIKILNVVITIAFNIFFFIIAPKLKTISPELFGWYDIKNGVGYILYSNLIASASQFLFLTPELRIKYSFDKALLSKILRYSFPIMILGIAGVLNQTMDKIIFPILYPNKADALTQLGIYGQSFKIAVIMVMFTQAFRYAFEPFIFAKDKSSSGKSVQSYADASKYFLILGLLIFLFTIGYMDIIKFLIPQSYHEGLKVVPIVMMGELFFGLYFNLSLWYKLTDNTKWGAYLSIMGFVITLIIQLLFIPTFSYMACAWAAFFSNLVMMIVSYFLGQKHYPIPYNLKTASLFTIIALVLFAGMQLTHAYIDNVWLRLCINTIFVVAYAIILIRKELPLHDIPVIGKYFKSK